jgi:hypothetical protein
MRRAITRPEESYRLWRVVVCNNENLVDEEARARAGLQSQRRPEPALGCRAREKKLPSESSHASPVYQSSKTNMYMNMSMKL